MSRVASSTRADYAAAAAAGLTGEGHEGETYELAGDVAWSNRELAAESASPPAARARRSA
ncbi:hypothetical protein Q5425_44800 [Amycolatopsis sp. A133]|uniref:hypothetical protein n=1 Tax=Amycolatopsis sp. A133 TaxID=3064472 RepID=UPI0027F1465E|nr:hypothetical protein [Amycolatopsis sp. A133]MDQ7810887.1 hypothetical protein [Amycolatopsis sp. A133]